MNSPKRKGDSFERELAYYFNQQCGTNCYRTPLSGGGRRDLVPTADITGLPELFVEAKRVERLNFHDALAQAERNHHRSGADEDITVVINRKNRQTTGDSLCLLRLDDLIRLYVVYLRSIGIKGEADDEDS